VLLPLVDWACCCAGRLDVVGANAPAISAPRHARRAAQSTKPAAAGGTSHISTPGTLGTSGTPGTFE